MYDGQKQARHVLFGLVFGALAAFFTILSDFVLLGTQGSAWHFFRLGTESMAVLPEWRIITGVFAGIIFLPLQIWGLVSVYYGLKPSGRFLSVSTVSVAAHALTMAVAFHTAYAFIAAGWRLYYETGKKDIPASLLVGSFNSYWNIIIAVILIEVSISSILFIYAILSGKSLYPKWMALFCPLVVYAVIYPLIYVLPSPIGGYVGPAYLNISTMVFFIISGVVVYKKLKYEHN